MGKRYSISSCPNSGETAAGFAYLAFQLLMLPGLLTWGNGKLSQPMNDAQLNFVFYLINFLAVVLIFHNLLGRGLEQVWRHPAYFCQAVILGLAAYYACLQVTGWIISQLAPGFSNYNDQSILDMSQGNAFLMGIGTVVLVPPAEECFYRGLIFRNLYAKSPWAGYVVSILAFSLIHILGFVGIYTPLELLMALLQYLPAGVCLAWCYTKADTIFAPILLHAAINFISFQALR